MEPEREIFDRLFDELCECKTLEDVRRVGDKGLDLLNNKFLRQEWLEVIRKAWFIVKKKLDTH